MVSLPWETEGPKGKTSDKAAVELHKGRRNRKQSRNQLCMFIFWILETFVKKAQVQFCSTWQRKCFQKLKAEPGRACQNGVPTAAAQWKVCGKAVLLQGCASLPRTGMFRANHEAAPHTPHTALKTFPSDTPQDSSKARERTVQQKPQFTSTKNKWSLLAFFFFFFFF